MTTLAIEQRAAQRLFANTLRDELRLSPERANEIAETLCRRVLTSMPDERSSRVGEWRAIESYPDRNPDLINKLRQFAPKVDQDTLYDIWHQIYSTGLDLPVDVRAKLTREGHSKRWPSAEGMMP